MELPLLLGGDDRLRTAAKAAVVDAGDGCDVMGEFGLNLRVWDDSGVGDGGGRGRKFGPFGDGYVVITVVAVKGMVLEIVSGHESGD